MRDIKRWLVALAASAALIGGAAPIAQSSAAPIPQSVVAAKTCSAGYTHAIIGGAHKCLRRGQYCAKRYDGTYHRYGFHCHTGRLR